MNRWALKDESAYLDARHSRGGQAVEETNVKINRHTMWVVCYQYRDHTGQAREGQSHYMSAEKAHAWKTGDRMPIRYDRDKPELSVWLS